MKIDIHHEMRLQLQYKGIPEPDNLVDVNEGIIKCENWRFKRLGGKIHNLNNSTVDRATMPESYVVIGNKS